MAALGIACCAACVPLNIAATPTELEYDLVETKAKALLVPETASTAVKDLARRIGILLLEYSVEESTRQAAFVSTVAARQQSPRPAPQQRAISLSSCAPRALRHRPRPCRSAIATSSLGPTNRAACST